MRKDRNQFTNINVILTILCSLLLAVWGGGGGGDAYGNAGGEDIAGTWTWSSMITEDSCHTPGEINVFDVTVTQNGNQVTFTNNEDGSTASGSITGNSITIGGSGTTDNGVVYDFTYSLTVSSDGETLSGTGSSTQSGGTCSAKIRVIAIATASTSGNLSGEWKGYHTTDGQAEEGPDLELFIQTGNDIVIMFYDDKEKVIVTQTGKLDGKNISFSFVSPHGGDTITGTGTVNNNYNSMSGTWTSTDGSSGTWRAEKMTSPAAPVITSEEEGGGGGGGGCFISTSASDHNVPQGIPFFILAGIVLIGISRITRKLKSNQSQ